MNEVYVGAAHTKFDGNGNLTDQGTVKFLDTVIANFQESMKTTDNAALRHLFSDEEVFLKGDNYEEQSV